MSYFLGIPVLIDGHPNIPCIHFCPQLDLQKPLSDQGPFSVIFHKLTDVVTQAAKGDNKARCMIDNLEVSKALSAVWIVFCQNWKDLLTCNAYMIDSFHLLNKQMDAL